MDSMSVRKQHSGTPLSEHASKLIELLESDLEKELDCCNDFAIAFSGGLDSSLLAALSKRYPGMLAYVVGTEGAVDIRNAVQAAGILGIELVVIELDEAKAVESAKQIARLAGTSDPLTISFEIPLFMAMRASDETHVISGQGCDELFGGYARYQRLDAEKFIRQRMEDVEKLKRVTVPAEDRLAMACNKLIRRPFLSREVVSYSDSIPPELIFPANERKTIIRESLRQLGYEELATREKKAAQYGSGAANLLRKAAKAKGVTINEFIKRLNE